MSLDRVRHEESREPSHSTFNGVLPSDLFRYIHLEPAPSEFDLIECVTVSVPWLERPEFVFAIVNEPTESPASHIIVRDNEEQQISEALYTALVKLRAYQCRNVWITTLCTSDATNETTNSTSARAQNAASQVFRFENGAKHGTAGSVEPTTFGLLRIDGDVRNGTTSVTAYQFSSHAHPDFTFVHLRLPMDTEWYTITVEGRPANVPFAFVSWINQMPITRHQHRYYYVSNISMTGMSRATPEALTPYVRSIASRFETVTIPLYAYTALPDPQRSIRLLKLEQLGPCQNTPPFPSVELITVDIESAPPYVALSYTWGDRNTAGPISVNRRSRLEVTQNLAHALRDLFELSFDYLWIDAICINQEDVGEKSTQVSRMKDIYRHAAEVIVHPFPKCRAVDCPHTSEVELIQNLARVAGTDKNTKTCLKVPQDKLVDHGLPDHSDRVWQAWAKIRSSPWFTRSWIVQEVMVNRNVHVLLHGVKVPFDHILLANHMLDTETLPVQLADAMVGRGNLETIGHIREDYWEISQRQPLLQILERTVRFEASEPRDKLYAFLGIAEDSKSAPPPDYALPLEQVLYDYACYFQQQDPQNGLRLIQAAGSSRRSVRIEKVPSWVPSWTAASKALVQGDLSLVARKGKRQWRAGGERGLLPVLEPETRTCTVSGFLIGRLVATTSICNELDIPIPSSEHTGDSTNYPTFYQQALEVMDRHKSIYSNHRQEYTNAIVAGCTSDGEPPPEAESFHQKISSAPSSFVLTPEWKEKLAQPEYQYLRQVCQTLEARRFAMTDSGFMCLTDWNCVPGDVVCVIAGLELPYVLRQSGESYELVSEAYVHGAMFGELLDTKSMRDISIR